MFQLSMQEWEVMRSQTATRTAGTEDVESQTATAKRRTPPFVFTEQGVSMLSAVLSSDKAIQVSIQIMQAFVAMRKTLNNLHGIIQRLEGVEIR